MAFYFRKIKDYVQYLLRAIRWVLLLNAGHGIRCANTNNPKWNPCPVQSCLLIWGFRHRLRFRCHHCTNHDLRMSAAFATTQITKTKNNCPLKGHTMKWQSTRWIYYGTISTLKRGTVSVEQRTDWTRALAPLNFTKDVSHLIDHIDGMWIVADKHFELMPCQLQCNREKKGTTNLSTSKRSVLLAVLRHFATLLNTFQSRRSFRTSRLNIFWH